MPLSALDRWMDYLIAGGIGGPSWSGERVHVENSQQLSTAYACISLIAELTASLPLHIYARGEDGSRTVARNNYLYPILHTQANPYSTAQAFREAMTRDAVAWGNGIAWKEYDSSQRVKALYRLRPDRVEMAWDEWNHRLFYRYKTEDGTDINFGQSEILHVLGPTLDGVTGVSVIRQYAYQSLGAAMAARKFGAKFFANGARATGVLSAPNKLSQAARDSLQQSTKAQIGGENKLGLLIVEEGMKFEALSIAPNDAQMLETIDASDHDICRWFRVPPVLAGVVSKTTSWGTGIEQLNIGFLQYTLQPWLERWEGAIQRDLIGTRAGSLYAEHDVAGLLRGDLKAQSEYLRAMVDGGLMTFNEARAKLNLNPVPGGEMFARPLNTTFITPDGDPVEALMPPEPEPAQPQQEQDNGA